MGVTMSKYANNVMVSMIISTDNENFRNFTGSLNKSAVIATLRKEFDLVTFNEDNYEDGHVEKNIRDINGNWIGTISFRVQESK